MVVNQFITFKEVLPFRVSAQPQQEISTLKKKIIKKERKCLRQAKNNPKLDCHVIKDLGLQLEIPDSIIAFTKSLHVFVP